jgi:hypothetical protein
MIISNKFKIDNLLSNTDFNVHPQYKKAIDNYNTFNDTNIYNFDYKVISNENYKDFFNVEYNDIKNKITDINNLFTSFEANLTTSDGKLFMRRLHTNQIKNNITLFNNIYSKLLPSIEKKIFNSNIKIIDINAYQNTICNSTIKKSSWLWHFDNHPNEFIKMIIYLTDVGPEDGPLEIIVDNNDRACKLKSNRITKNDYIRKNFEPDKYFKGQYDGNRISENDIEELLQKGYKKKKIIGKKGTIILFSENIIHRANYCKKNYRNIINTVLAPSCNKLTDYIQYNYLQDPKRYAKWLD